MSTQQLYPRAVVHKFSLSSCVAVTVAVGWAPPPVSAVRARRARRAMVLHGLLVLHARAGTTIYSQRFSPAFGLTTIDLGTCFVNKNGVAV